MIREWQQAISIMQTPRHRRRIKRFDSRWKGCRSLRCCGRGTLDRITADKACDVEGYTLAIH